MLMRDAQKDLDMWKSAETAIESGDDYTINDVILSKKDLSLVKAQVEKFEGLVEALTNLAEWKKASLKITNAQSYSISTPSGQRVVTRADLGEVRKQINFWELRVKTLAPDMIPGPRIRYANFS